MMQTTSTGKENSNTYKVDLLIFQGPLDLLLSLIEQEELDITKISLAQVTNQYLAYLEIMKETDPDDLTDFLVIAAKLIWIKSKMLLPQPPSSVTEEEEEDVGDELARQLRIYKRFKAIAVRFRELEMEGQRSYVRIAPPPKIERRLTPGEVSLDDLLHAARNALTIRPPEPDVDEVVSPELVTLGQQMAHIWQEITATGKVSLFKLLSQNRNRLEIIVTLLAILELIKRFAIEVKQAHIFGDIIIRKNENAPVLTEAEWEELTGLTEIS
jgi:segregation and condensation protein A